MTETAEVPLLESQTSSFGQEIENNTIIIPMPLHSRIGQELAVLTAGVPPDRHRDDLTATSSVSDSGFRQTVFTLDGTNNNYYSKVSTVVRQRGDSRFVTQPRATTTPRTSPPRPESCSAGWCN